MRGCSLTLRLLFSSSLDKGSTCCFTESILRHSGCRTGLYTSPHLLDIRERIRLDGIPVSEDMYLDHFWWTFDTLKVLGNSHGKADV